MCVDDTDNRGIRVVLSKGGKTKCDKLSYST